MSDDKILFLSFLTIYDSLSVEFIRTTYQESVEELNLKDAWGFDRVLNWFRDDKINIDVEDIRFSYPSYSEALKNLLVENEDFTTINKEIFSKLLLNLSKKDVAVWWPNKNAIAYNFDKLPENVKNALDGLPKPLQQVIGDNVRIIKGLSNLLKLFH